MKEKAQLYYKAAEVQARLPVFYEEYEVPDTPYGRFDMIALHCYLLVRRLNENGEKRVSQKIFDIMFKTLALAMRELGVGDLSLPKKMNKFMQGFNGRANIYESAIESGDDEALKEALLRNIYGTAENVSDKDVAQMVRYIKANLELEGKTFASPETELKKVA